MAALNETGVPASRCCVAEQGIIMPNLWQTLQSFWSYSSVFALGKYPKDLNFWSIFAYKRTFGYIQCNMCTHM